MSAPLSTTARRFVRLARQEVDASRRVAVRAIAGKAGTDTLWQATLALRDRIGGKGYGPTRIARELNVLGRVLWGVPGIFVAPGDTGSNKKAAFLAIVPAMQGHAQKNVDEPETITLEGLLARSDRKYLEVDGQIIIGCLTAHCVGRLAERMDHVEPREIPAVVEIASAAAYLCGKLDHHPRTIACRITRTDPMYLVGRTRTGFQIARGDGRHTRDGERNEIAYADWRTVLPGDWLTPGERLFGDLMVERIQDRKTEELPVLPVRADHIDRLGEL